jgi:hypothetical protein
MRWLLVLASLPAALVGCGDDLRTKPIDAAIDAPPNPSCAACNPATQYCYQIFAGVLPAVGCNALPAACTTCACVLADIDPCGGALSCAQDTGLITVSCTKP